MISYITTGYTPSKAQCDILNISLQHAVQLDPKILRSITLKDEAVEETNANVNTLSLLCGRQLRMKDTHFWSSMKNMPLVII